MTRLGTAYVDVKPDFSAFDRFVAQKLGRSFASVGEQSGRDFNKGFDKHASGLVVPISRALRDVGTDAVDTTKAVKSMGKALTDASASAKKINTSLATMDGSKALAERTRAARADSKAAKTAGSTLARSASIPDISPIGRVDAKLAGADAEITAITAHLAELQKTPDPSLEVQIKIAKAIAALEAVEKRRDALAKQRTELVVSVDQRAVNDAFAALNKLQDTRKLPAIVPLPAGAALADLNARISARQSARNPSARDGAASFAPTIAAAKAAGDAADEAGRKIAAVVEGAALDLSRTGRIDLQIGGAKAEVHALRTELDALNAKPRTVTVDGDIGRLVAKLDQAEAKVARLESKRIEIKADVDKSLPGTLSNLSSSFTGLFASLGGSGGGGLGAATARVSAGFISFGTAAGPLAAILGALAVTIAVSLVGALVALASSAALAVAALGALGVAAGGILGVSLGLLIPVVIRMSKVFESLKADNAATDQAAQGAAAGSQAAAAAAKAQESAARGLTDANRQLGVASKQAYREMADAAEAASDAVRSVAQAQLSREQADLNTDKAVADLAALREELGATGDAFGATFDKFTDVSVDTSGLSAALASANATSGGTVDDGGEIKLRQAILDVRQARLSEKDAIDGVSDALTASERAQARHNEFVKQGIAASEGYSSALRGVESAAIAVAAANEQAKTAQDVGATNAAQEKAELLTGRLTASEVKLKLAIQEVGKELRGAFTPATDAVITSLTTGLSRVPALVNPLRASFARLGEAWGKAVDAFSADLIRPQTVSSFRAFIDAAAKLTGPITAGLSSLLTIFLNIGKAALPYLVKGTRKVADQLGEWAKATSDTKALNATMKTLMGHLKTWLGVGAAIGRVFLAFLPIAAISGKGLAESIKDLADRTAEWLGKTKNQGKVRQFFKDTVGFAKDLAGFFGTLIGFATRFGATTAGVLSRVSKAMGGANSAAAALVYSLGTLAALKFAGALVRGAQATAVAFQATKRAAILMHASFVTGNAITRTAGKVQAGFAAILNGTALAAARQKIAMVASRVATIAMSVAAKAAAAAQVLLNIALTANPIGLVIAALVALGVGLVVAYQKSETFRNIVDAAFRFVKRVAVEAIQAIIKILDGLLGAWSTMLSALGKVPGFGWAKTAARWIDDARQKLRGLADNLNELPKIKEVKIKVSVKDPSGIIATLSNGKTVRVDTGMIHRAGGGIVPGVGRGDRIPALLEPLEYVTRRKIVMRFGPTVFADINAGRLDPTIGYQEDERPSIRTVTTPGPRYATGGLVARSATPTVQESNVTVLAPIQVAASQNPDAVDLSYKLHRLVERVGGGSPRQEY